MDDMQDYKEFFKGKKITLMGLGLLGRGVGDAEFLAKLGAELIVTDLKSKEALSESIDKLKSFSNITFVLGEHRLQDFSDRDLIIKAAGVPLDSIYIAEAKKNNIPVAMSADLFARFAGIHIVGVTGTRGKTTTTYLIYEMLKNAGKHVLLGGNIRGVSTLSLLSEVTPDSIALFELDSWQLQGFGDSKISPQVAVFTTFMPDHMEYYHDDMDAYLLDKAQIFLNQKAGDTLVVGVDVAAILKGKYASHITSKIVVADPQNFPNGVKLLLRGEHNILNAMCSIEAARALDIDESSITKALETFPGVPGRQEFIGEVRGVQVFNDTTATTPAAVIAALRTFGSDNKNIVLILGGKDKGLAVEDLLLEIPKYCKKVFLLEGSGTDKVKDLLGAPVYESFAPAVSDAFNSCDKGDVLLLSPGFSSKGMFANEYDRGDQFVELIKNLK